MAYYDLPKTERDKLPVLIGSAILDDLEKGTVINTLKYFSDPDTYMRKAAYIQSGKIYSEYPEKRKELIAALEKLLSSDDFKVRQTTINAAGEIGKRDFNAVEKIMITGMSDKHHSPRNAVIGSLKKMGEVNPEPVIRFSKKYINHPDKEVRREICHGLELRGRTHPKEILPLLRELEFEKNARVKNMLIHVIGQISYKEGCLAEVVNDLAKWKNKEIVKKSIAEIIEVHKRYRNFAAMSPKDAKVYIDKNIKIIL